MRTSPPVLLLVLLVVVGANGAFAFGPQVGVPGSSAQGMVRSEQDEAAEEQVAEVAGEDARQEIEPEPEPAATVPGALPAIGLVTTDEQEAALRLVETILAEQRLLLSGQNFVYQAEGRRDPFRSLLAVGSREIAAPELRPAGLSGFLISEITIVATASYQGRWQAMIMGRDRRTYFVRVGDVLYDGRIVEIAGEEVIFEQEVEDLLGARSKLRVSKRLVIGNQEY